MLLDGPKLVVKRLLARLGYETNVFGGSTVMVRRQVPSAPIG